jgi:hypothetical protein
LTKVNGGSVGGVKVDGGGWRGWVEVSGGDWRRRRVVVG